MRNKIIIITLCIVLFLDSISGGIVYPMLPALFMDNQHGLITQSYLIQYRGLLYGLSFITFPLTSILGMPILGSLSDRIGRKPTLLIGVFGIILTQFISVSAIMLHNVWLFLLGGLILGFSCGTYSVASATLIDISESEEDKLVKLKYPMLTGTAGAILGPGLSSFVYDQAPSTLSVPFIITLIIAIINFMILCVWFPNSKIVIPNASLKQIISFKYIFKSISYMFKITKIRKLTIAYLILIFGINLYLQPLSVYLNKVYHYEIQKIGIFFIIMQITSAFSIFIFHRFLQMFISIRQQIYLGIIVTACSLILNVVVNVSFKIAGIDSSFNIWFFSILFYTFVPFVTLNLTQVFSNLVSNDDQGQIMGGMGQLGCCSAALSGLFVGSLSYLHENISLIISASAILLSYFLIRGKIYSQANTE